MGSCLSKKKNLKAATNSNKNKEDESNNHKKIDLGQKDGEINRNAKVNIIKEHINPLYRLNNKKLQEIFTL